MKQSNLNQRRQIVTDPCQSAAARTIVALRAISLEAEAGDYLGSESYLLGRLGVSRPTMRQAAKVVESESLLSVRRGVNGGFYAKKPDARHVVQVPALYLRLQAATLRDTHQASELIWPATAAIAATCEDSTLRKALRAIRDTIAAINPDDDQSLVANDHEIELAQLITHMSANPVLMLFLDISYAFGVLEHDFNHYARPTLTVTWRSLQVHLCDAILNGDADLAELYARRRSALITEWIKDREAEQ